MLKSHKTLLAVGFCMLLSLGTQAQSQPDGSSIEELMTPEQYRAAGLGRLSTSEREALYQWLLEFKNGPSMDVAPAVQKTQSATAATAMPAPSVESEAQIPVPDSATRTAAAATSQAPTSVDSQGNDAAIEENFGLPEPVDPVKAAYQLRASIKEPFRGWSGDTVFYLDNGQVWKQRTSGRHTYTGDDNRVVISENALGFYEMRLLDADRSIGVKRIK